MKKVVAMLVMLFGASVSMFAHADMSQGSTNSGQQATQPQGADQSGSNPQSSGSSTDSSGSAGSSTNSGSSSPSDDSDDTAS